MQLSGECIYIQWQDPTFSWTSDRASTNAFEYRGGLWC